MGRMRSTLAAAGTAATLLAAHAGQAATTVINFDNLANGTVVTNQYPTATFSSVAGEDILTTAQNLGSSLPNFICTGSGGIIDCVNDVFISFTNPVNGLHFVATGANNTGVIAQIDVTAASGNGVVDIIGAGDPNTPVAIDLTAFTGVSGISIVNDVDVSGLGFDDFTFDAGGGGVPEPASWALVLAGLGAAGALLRGSRRQHARA